MLTENFVGKNTSEIDSSFKKFHYIVAGEGEDSDFDSGKLEIFAGVQECPALVSRSALNKWLYLRNGADSH